MCFEEAAIGRASVSDPDVSEADPPRGDRGRAEDQGHNDGGRRQCRLQRVAQVGLSPRIIS
eukprot:4130735-Lingulodinium_polyedra.AAC.1